MEFSLIALIALFFLGLFYLLARKKRRSDSGPKTLKTPKTHSPAKEPPAKELIETYYINKTSRNGEEEKLTLNQIKALLAVDEITDKTWAYWEGLAEWKTVADIPGIEIKNKESELEPAPESEPECPPTDVGPFSLLETVEPGDESLGKEDIVVGLDFGTSLTKVVVAAPDVDKHFAVPFFPRKKGVKRYLQPTVLYRDEKGQKFSLTEFKGAIPRSNLKLNFINWAKNDQTNIESPSQHATDVVNYLALIICKAIGHFIKVSKRDFKGYQFDWMLNLGIPARNLRDDRVGIAFKNAAYAAWELALNSGTPNKCDAKDYWRAPFKADFSPTGSHKDYINIYPELSAQIMGFIKSEYGQDGLYLMMDVGAGTMDVAVFDANIQTQVQNIQYYTGCVEFLGCLELFQERRAAIRKHRDDNDWGADLISEDIGNLPFHQLEKAESDRAAVNEANKIFIKRCWIAVLREIALAKKKYFGRRAPGMGRLNNGLPYFLCGGGSGEELYRDIFYEVGEQMRNYRFAGFRHEPLSPPESLVADESLKAEDYHRISVAFGLSHFILNLPEQKGFAEALLDQR